MELCNTSPLTHRQAIDLFRHIESHLGEPDDACCDHSHHLAKGWCEQAGLKPAEVIGWLKSMGGHCDCEVLFNVASKLAGEA